LELEEKKQTEASSDPLARRSYNCLIFSHPLQIITHVTACELGACQGVVVVISLSTNSCNMAYGITYNLLFCMVNKIENYYSGNGGGSDY
jgi:hypothetical protein